MSWQLYLITALVSYITLDLIQRKIAQDTAYPRAMGVFYNAVVCCFTAIIFFSTHRSLNFQVSTSPSTWFFVAVALVCYGLYERGRFEAIKRLDLSVNSIVSNISVVVALIGAFVLYREALTMEKVVGSLLIIGALTLVAYHKRKDEISTKGLLISIGIHVALGLGWMLDKMGVATFGVELYGLMLWVLPLGIIIFPKVPLHELKVVMREKPWLTVVTALLNTIGYYSQLQALTTAEATIVIPVLQTISLCTVILGIWVLNEKSHVGKKLAGGAIAALGAWLIVR